LADRFKVDISNKPITESIDTYVDDHCSRLDHLGSDEVGLADRDQKYVGESSDRRQVQGLAVATSHRCIGVARTTWTGFLKAHVDQRFSDNIAAAYHDNMLSANLKTAAIKQL
jgi:tetrahydromethanopterin S-methyltransferase subunit F